MTLLAASSPLLSLSGGTAAGTAQSGNDEEKQASRSGKAEEIFEFVHSITVNPWRRTFTLWRRLSDTLALYCKKSL
jgi:hypothetical protein